MVNKMIDFATYGHFYGAKKTYNDGDIRKIQSDSIIESTWFRDLQSCVGYLYDYLHDDEPSKNTGINSTSSKTKIPIDIKFIINSYNADDKTQVPYTIQFKPSQECNVDYYENEFAQVCNSEFPLGLYIDIPDNKGVYRRWLIYKGGNVYNRQFTTWEVLPCNYCFYWVKNGVKHKMWGVRRFRETDITTIQDGVYTSNINGDENIILLPFNKISHSLTYDDRLIVGALVDNPMVWQIISVNNIDYPGINRFVSRRSKFDANTDFIEKDSNGHIIGMWADYNVSPIQPVDPVLEPEESLVGEFIKVCYKGVSPTVKIGGSYKTVYIQRYDKDGGIIDNIGIANWTFSVDGEVLNDDIIEKVNIDDYTLKFKFLGDMEYTYKVLTVSASIGDITNSVEFEIVGL